MATPVIPWQEYLSSVADVWAIWALSLLALVLLVRRAFRFHKWSGASAFASDERGASYALSYVLTFPFYLLLMCLIIQATLILMVKMGTVYAAYAAARTAVVWRPSQPERPTSTDERYDYTLEKAERAAALAMTPFSTGYEHHLNGLFPWARLNLFSQADALAYENMYNTIGSYNASVDRSNYLYFLRRFDTDALAKKQYVKNKLLFASHATDVEFDEELVPWNEDVQVTVSYTMPMHVPAVGRVFGDWYRPFFAKIVSTTATLPSEAAETESHRINIPYDPYELRSPVRW